MLKRVLRKRFKKMVESIFNGYEIDEIYARNKVSILFDVNFPLFEQNCKAIRNRPVDKGSIRMSIAQITDAAIIKDAESLPPFPQVVHRLIPLLHSLAPLSEVEQVIQYDPIIAARVLRVARSPYYGGARVKTLRDAVVFLGQRTLCETIVAACSMGYFKDLDAYNGTSVHQAWQHSIAVAVMSQILATRMALRTALANFMAGLLHDFGKMVLNSYLRPHKEAFAQALASGLSMREAEETILGIDHAAVGGIIAESWQLPNVVIASIRHHHAPEEGGEFRRNAAVVCAADLIALQAGYGYEGEWHIENSEQRVLNDLKITPKDLVALVKQANQAVKGAMSAF